MPNNGRPLIRWIRNRAPWYQALQQLCEGPCQADPWLEPPMLALRRLVHDQARRRRWSRAITQCRVWLRPRRNFASANAPAALAIDGNIFRWSEFQNPKVDRSPVSGARAHQDVSIWQARQRCRLRSSAARPQTKIQMQSILQNAQRPLRFHGAGVVAR